MSDSPPVAFEGASAKMYEVSFCEGGLYLRRFAVEMPEVPNQLLPPR